MTLKSMTGFGRADGASAASAWHWEVRSVNGRGLDVRLRLPPGYEALEPKAREAILRHATRGSITATLFVRRTEAESEIRINQAALRQILAAIAAIRVEGDFAPPRPEGILALRGVMGEVETIETEATREAQHRTLLTGLDQALATLVAARTDEGARLGRVIGEQLDSIASLVETVAASPARQPEAIKARLKDNIARLLDASSGALDETRLHQEAVLLATRADVEEELKRLESHIAAARALIAGSEPAGRRFDFLAQEFNREANTLCSKANDPDITRAGLALKATIDQLREQVQNLE